MTDERQRQLDALVDVCSVSGDMVMIDALPRMMTEADRFRAGLRASLACLVQVGLLDLPSDERLAEVGRRGIPVRADA